MLYSMVGRKTVVPSSLAKATVALVACLSFAACTKGSSSSSTSTAIVVSGKINVSAGSQKARAFDSEKLSALTVNLSSYSVTCATLTPPIQTGTAAMDSSGNFSINIPDSNGQPMSCHMVDATGVSVGDFLLTDSANKDMNGHDSVSSTIALHGNADLGTVNYDPDAKEVTVPKANVSSSLVDTSTVATVFDPTGAWTISAADFTLPPGVASVCTGGGGGGGNNCDGPPAGQTIFMKLWKGAVVSSGADVYGLQLWENQASFNTCGGKVGLPAAQQTAIGVSFSQQGTANADFSFATSVNGFADLANNNILTNINLTENWKMSNAKSQYNIQTACGPHDLTVGGVNYANSWRCGPDPTHSNHYQYQLGGGCFVSGTTTPINVDNWGNINCGAAVEDAPTKVVTSTCTGTFTPSGGSSTAVTCSNKWVITDSSDVPLSNGAFDWTALNGSQIPSGTLCSSGLFPNTPAGDIARLQCYSNYYWQSGMSHNSNACMPRVDTDWSASTAADFVHVDFRPSALVFFDQYRPNTDGNGGQILTRQERYNGVNVNGSWINCRVIESGGLSFKKISPTKLLAIYQSSSISTSTSKPACMAEFAGSHKMFMFYLNK